MSSLNFTWTENWPNFSRARGEGGRWSHPGLAMTSDGLIVMTHPSDRLIVLVHPNGLRVRSWSGEFGDAHGLAISRGVDGDHLLVADPGIQITVRGGAQRNAYTSGRVFEFHLDGRLIQSIGAPPIALHRLHGADFRPTSAARFGPFEGGNGDIWIADGYGTSLVHRFRSDGQFIASLTGEEGLAGAFRNPHALLIDTRGPEPELLIADRHNSRIQVYDLDGKYKRTFGSEHLLTPSSLAVHGDWLYVAELTGRVSILDARGQLVAYLGTDEESRRRDGWPNARSGLGRIVRPAHELRKFNSPHAITVDASGSIYVAEFVLGGRYLRLQPED